MGFMTIRVVNRSKHEFVCTGSYGTQLSSYPGTIIPPNTTVEIGRIDIPRDFGFNEGNWGWWYVQDTLNLATIEFFAYVDPRGENHSNDKVSAGLRANNSHDKDRKGGPTPNKLDQYLSYSKDQSSFTLTIKSDWTDNPPDYIFNYGHYPIFSFEGEWAAHSYVKVVSFDGKETVDFDCYGGTAPDNNGENWVYPALSFVATKEQLRLARTICCFDPTDTRPSYGRKPGLSPVTPSGELLLGDCCGIIYLHSGVCHQMANRICAAVTDLDVGDLADMAGYNFSHAVFGTYGNPPPPSGPKEAWDILYKIFSSQVAITDEQLLKLGVRKDAPYPVNLLFRPWEDYLSECKKKVKQLKE